MTYRFLLKTELFSGLGWCRDHLAVFLRDKGMRKVMLYVDQGVAEHSEYFAEVLGHLKSAAELTMEILRGTEEPDYDYLDEVAGRARAVGRFDLVMAMGGGSCMDMVKGVAALLNNPGRGIDYRGFDKVVIPSTTTMLIPTTAGTGAEVTVNAVFTDKNEMKKLGINGQHMHADYAVHDALLTLSCPYSVALSSGMDALTHALESFSCKQHNDLTRVFSREAVRLLCKHLPAIKEDPDNVEHRQKLLLAAYLAGAGLFNSGSGIAGAFSYPIGVHFKVPHGIGGAIFLTSVVEYNVERGYMDYAELLDMVEPHPDWSEQRKSGRFAELMRELTDRLGVPRTLEKWGVAREKGEMVCKLLEPLQAAFDQNPVSFSAKSDVPEFLYKHLV